MNFKKLSLVDHINDNLNDENDENEELKNDNWENNELDNIIEKTDIELSDDDINDINDLGNIIEEDYYGGIEEIKENIEEKISNEKNDELLDQLEYGIKILEKDKVYNEKYKQYNPNDIQLIKEMIILTGNDRITSEIMTIYEYTELISNRASHIINGGKIYTNVDGLNDPIKMAEKELHDNKCPLSILRQISKIEFELWSAIELIKPI